jgi:hypothetical protein
VFSDCSVPAEILDASICCFCQSCPRAFQAPAVCEKRGISKLQLIAKKAIKKTRMKFTTEDTEDTGRKKMLKTGATTNTHEIARISLDTD